MLSSWYIHIETSATTPAALHTKIMEENMEKVHLISQTGYKAEVSTYGCHVLSWRDQGGRDVIFLSKKAVFEPPKAIRGGIPICWPQFSDYGPCKSQHGFARNSMFEVVDSSDSHVEMALVVNGEEEGTKDEKRRGIVSKEFPYSCTLYVRVELNGDALRESVRVVNESTCACEFSIALHTYFRLEQGIVKAGVRGLKGKKYLDSLQKRITCLENEDIVRFRGEVDRIYLQTGDVVVVDDGGAHGIQITKQGFQDAVVWNPYIHKSAALKDFGDDEWKEMVCVEVCQAGSGMVVLPPGDTWCASQELKLVDLVA